jgi:isocitrate lyase
MGGKVFVPTQRRSISTLVAARLAADVLDVPTVLVARTDAESADLVDGGRRRARPSVHRSLEGSH